MFDFGHIPEAVVEVVVVLYPYPLVLLGNVLGGHGRLAHSQGVLLPLGKDAHNCSYEKIQKKHSFKFLTGLPEPEPPFLAGAGAVFLGRLLLLNISLSWYPVFGRSVILNIYKNLLSAGIFLKPKTCSIMLIETR